MATVHIKTIRRINENDFQRDVVHLEEAIQDQEEEEDVEKGSLKNRPVVDTMRQEVDFSSAELGQTVSICHVTRF
jgi:hypothetical protein